MSERTRFDNVVHVDDVPVETWGDEGGRFGAESREVALAVGAVDLGYCVVSLAPGKRSCPYHFHHCEEEMFHVVSGEGILRQGDEAGEEEVTLRAGDFVAFPAGTGIAHQFENRSQAPFVYLAFSNRIKPDVAEYPDSDKILFRGTRRMLRRTPTLEYFDGES